MTIANWCVLAAALMPIVFTGLAKFSGLKYNNKRPREFQAQLTGWRLRAHWAHLNSFEAFPFFAAGVLVAQQAGADQTRVDQLALAYIAARVVYGGMYIANLAPVRSLVWAAAFGINCALFFLPT
ncbi:MAG TPA: MAPEG family protein [Xanthomonadales bacterium]|nr:MAPEG family protein [Xanthomonadales bacterium]